MRASTQNSRSESLVLNASSAAELMTSDPVSVREDAPLREAARLLMDKDISAVPVVDEAGRPVGVLSRTDLVRYLSETVCHPEPAMHGAGAASASSVGAPHVAVGELTVREIMTPAILSVPPDTTAVDVVAHLLGLGNVHRVFVEDSAGAVVGVVSARDVLRKLHRPDAQ